MTDKEIKSGFKSLDEKWDNMCPFFSEMDKLFGGRENITPSYVFDSENQYPEPLTVSNNETPEIFREYLYYPIENYDSEGSYQENDEHGSLFKPESENGSLFKPESENGSVEPTVDEEFPEVTPETHKKTKKIKINLPDFIKKIITPTKNLKPVSLEDFRNQKPKEQVTEKERKDKQKNDFNSLFKMAQDEKAKFQNLRLNQEKELKQEEIKLKEEEMKLKKKETILNVYLELAKLGKNEEEIDSIFLKYG